MDCGIRQDPPYAYDASIIIVSLFLLYIAGQEFLRQRK